MGSWISETRFISKRGSPGDLSGFIRASTTRQIDLVAPRGLRPREGGLYVAEGMAVAGGSTGVHSPRDRSRGATRFRASARFVVREHRRRRFGRGGDPPLADIQEVGFRAVGIR